MALTTIVEKDAKRTAYLASQGFSVLRFSNREVMTEINGVLEAIYSHLTATPTPNPSPQAGRGARARSASATELPMLAYIIRRLASTVLVMGIVAVFVFLLLHLSPGDPAAIIAGDNATGEQIAAIRKQLGLDDPLPVQFVRWVCAVLQGDLGISIFSNEPVLKLIGQRIEPTLSLALTTLIVAVTLAVSFGVLAAWKVGTWIDRVADGRLGDRLLGAGVRRRLHADLRVLDQSALAAGAGLFADRPGLRPVDRAADPALDRARPGLCGADRAHHPHLDARSAGRGLHPHRRAKGVATRSMLLKHALKNAGVPIVTVIGIGVALLIGGVVITETVFNIPGVGRLVVDAISKRDYPIIQGVILIFSGVYVLVNLLVDLTYTLLDPRIRY